MPRYEFRDAKSAKFWEIELKGTAYTVTYGRIGTDGQSKTKDFGDPAKAQREHDRVVASKVKKGYVLVPTTPPGQLTTERHPELEAAIIADPGSAEAWAVYGDWLQSQGDVRGELIALQLSGAQAELQALLSANQDQLLGAFAPAFKAMSARDKGWNSGKLAELKWHFGFVNEALIGAEFEGAFDAPQMLRDFLASPAGQFVFNLRVGLPNHDGQADFQETIDALVESGPHPSVRRLHLGDFEYPDETEISWTEVGDVTPLIGAFPNLTELHVTGGEITLRSFESAQLTSLKLETGGLPGGVVKAIGESDLPALKRLEIWLGADDYGAGTTPDELAGVLSGERLPALRNLGIMNGEIMDDVAERLATAPVLKQLERLDLSMGTMTARGAQAILDNQAAFDHLQHLDISSNCIPEAQENALKAAFGDRLVAGDQEDIDDYGYVSVGE